LPDINFLDDFRSWCHPHSALAVDPTAIHEPIVAKFYINSCDDIFVFITTRKLISTASLSGMLQVDTTFKLNWNELPVLVFGSSDGNRRFHPYGTAVIGTTTPPFPIVINLTCSRFSDIMSSFRIRLKYVHIN
jgi:hypothetical protein